MKNLFITFMSMITLSTLAQESKKREYPTVIVEETIEVTADSAFNYIVPVKLDHIFKRYKNLPAVIRTDEKQKWFTSGLSRTVYFEDGSTAYETLLTVYPSKSFSYKVENFTSPLRHLAKRIEGNWEFSKINDKVVKIKWTYAIVPKNFMARHLIRWFLLKNVKGLLSNAMEILKKDLEITPN